MKKEDQPKILLTGGHLSPLLAVVSKLQEEAELVVVGRRYTFEADKTESLEYKTFQERHIPFYNLPNARLQRKLTRYTIPSLMRFPYSFQKALSILKKEKPDVVLTFGGYVGLPVSLAASVLKIPIVLHEQTQKAGLSNKIIGKLAQKICISHESSKHYFDPKKTVLTGNPLRPEIFTVESRMDIKTAKPILCVMGGSAGSHRVNMYMKDILRELLDTFYVIHQTGDAQEYKDYDALLEFKKSLNEKAQESYTVVKFIGNEYIGWVYKNTDMFVVRSGANTVQELLVLQKKALLIPLAYSQGSEQLENAKLYKNSGFGSYISEADIDSQKLYNEILSVYKRKVDSRSSVYKDEAADKISQIVLSSAHHEKAVI